MKKFNLIAFGLVGLMSVGVASADTLTNTSNVYQIADCGLLSNDVTITLTSGVVGGITCNDTDNVIGLSVCHESGQAAERSTSVSNGQTIPGTTQDCTDSGGCVGTVSGSAFPAASTAKGTVQSLFPGDTCTAGNAETQSSSIITIDLDV